MRPLMVGGGSVKRPWAMPMRVRRWGSPRSGRGAEKTGDAGGDAPLVDRCATLS